MILDLLTFNELFNNKFTVYVELRESVTNRSDEMM